MPRIRFLNTSIDNITMEEAIIEADLLIQEKKCHYVVTPNLDHIVMLEEDKKFQSIYHDASLILADGKPLIWISKMLGTPIKEKISGSDFFPLVCEMAARKGYSVYILGAAEGVAEKAAENLCLKYNGLKIAGFYSPEYGFEKKKEVLEEIQQRIKEAKPDILAVALGTPKGEKYIYEHRNDLGVPLSLSIGATIDFEAGHVKRAPKWMSDVGLEWLFRITQDPKRLIGRYWKDARRTIPIMWKYRKLRSHEGLDA